MIVAALRLQLYLPQCQTLKEKRMIVRALLEGIRAHFPAATAEVGFTDLHQRAEIGIAVVSGQRNQTEALLDHIERFVDAHLDGIVSERERFSF
ncbi:MAG: DUF503 domain-containing protein [Firmicutes bacterium]|nr:DUF503 domain-containing protein [Bacillota bacterium]